MEYEPVLSEAAWGGLAGIEAFFGQNGYEIVDVYGRPLTAAAPRRKPIPGRAER